MKNITLSVDEQILNAVRRCAAERNSSVNALIREYLATVASHEDRARQVRKRLREFSQESQVELGDRDWQRDDLHER